MSDVPASNASLLAQYTQQAAWRRWDAVLDAVFAAIGAGTNVELAYDLGCGPGLVTKMIRQREQVAKVIGVDMDASLLPQEDDFLQCDIRDVMAWSPKDDNIDLLFSSFLVAYCGKDLSSTASQWAEVMAPGAMLAVVEVTGLFTGHGPLTVEASADLQKVEACMLANNYDCQQGLRMREAVEQTGKFQVISELDFPDDELSFQGPACSPAVLTAWRRRFDRVGAVKSALGDARAEAIKEEFVQCLERPDHQCSNTVRLLLARRL